MRCGPIKSLALLGLALCCLLPAAGCHSTTSKTIRRNPNIIPFDFKVASGHDEFQIEGYLARSDLPGPRPVLLVLNPAAGDAGHCITADYHFTQLGISLACISLPGSGKSSGPGRFVGPQSVAAVRRALDLLAARPDVDKQRMGVWGLGDGAVAAGLMMDSGGRLRVVILQSGTYDMVHFWPRAHLLTKLSILRQVWPSRRALKERSVIDRLPPSVSCKVLILHGKKDKHAPLSQAERLAAALRERGAEVETRFFPDAGDRLGSRVDPVVTSFLRRNLAAQAEAKAPS